MQVEAIYDHGRLSFVSPVKLRHQRLPVVVEIPESEIDDQPVVEEQLDPEVTALVARLDAIRNAPLPPDADLPPVTPKQIERYEAFLLREDR